MHLHGCLRRYDIGPFQVAIALTILSLVLILVLWDDDVPALEEESTHRYALALLQATYAVYAYASMYVLLRTVSVGCDCTLACRDEDLTSTQSSSTITTDGALAGSDEEATQSSPQSGSIMQSIIQNFTLISKKPKILCVGMSQACFEGATYSFGMYQCVSCDMSQMLICAVT